MREVDEAVRQAQLDDIARKYGLWIIAAIVLALVAFGGYLLWQDRREKAMEQRTEELVMAFDQFEAGNIQNAQEAFATLEADADGGPAIVARLTRAGLLLGEGKREEAARIYEEVAGDGKAPGPFRDLAAVRSVAINFEDMEPQAVIDRLKPLATPGNPWFGSAGEFVAMAYLAQGREDLAGPLLAEIAKSDEVPETLRSRTRQLAGLLGVDAIEDVESTLAEMSNAEAGAGPEAAARP